MHVHQLTGGQYLEDLGHVIGDQYEDPQKGDHHLADPKKNQWDEYRRLVNCHSHHPLLLKVQSQNLRKVKNQTRTKKMMGTNFYF